MSNSTKALNQYATQPVKIRTVSQSFAHNVGDKHIAHHISLKTGANRFFRHPEASYPGIKHSFTARNNKRK